MFCQSASKKTQHIFLSLRAPKVFFWVYVEYLRYFVFRKNETFQDLQVSARN